MHVRNGRQRLKKRGATLSRLPILVVGAGAMGGAMIAGWLRAGAVTASDLMIVDPHPSAEAMAAAEAGAMLAPDNAAMARARTVLFAVKPQVWREAAADIAPRLGPHAAIVSIIAGVAARDLSAALGGRPIARAMPTLAAAIGAGSIALWPADGPLTDETEALLAPLGAVTRLADEDLMHVATAASGSATAYLYAFIEALEAGAVEAGLPPDEAARAVRATVCGAAALLAQSGEDPADLRRRVTSPGGTTQAALETLLPELGPLLARAVAAAAARSRELGQ
ncbi:MAG: pyrroline-5-carboxylate reductase [Caulobacteraceae bacterium]